MGLLVAVKKLRRSPLSHADVDGRDEGLDLLTGLIAFCFLSSAVMLLPGLAELLLRIDSSTALQLHRLGLYVLMLLVGCTSIAGFIFTFAFDLFEPYFRGLSWASGLLQKKDRPGKLITWISMAIMSVYLVTAQSLAPINYDTALYHLPAVIHLKQYGAEIGLANLHFSLGFYNLPLFGQAVLQAFSPSRLILTPSLNIIFCIGLFSVMLAGLFRAWKAAPGRAIDRHLFSQFLFLVAVLLFGQLDIGSLSSFNADFALSCTTMALIYCSMFADGYISRRQVLLLTFLLPAIKLSGILGVIFIIFYRVIRFCLDSLRRRDRLSRSVFRGAVARIFDDRCLGVVAISYLIVFATYVVLSGYIVFPQAQTGLGLVHAVPLDQVKYIQGALVSFYARANDNPHLSQTAYREGWSLRQWLPVFLATPRGQMMLLWLSLSFVLPLLSLCQLALGKRSGFSRHLAFNSSTALTVSLALLVMPPNPRFFPWLGPMIAYSLGELMIASPAMVFVALLILVNLTSLRLQLPLLKSVGDIPTVSLKIPLSDIRGWRPRAATRSDLGDYVLLRKPPADKCWATERPCTPYLWFLKGDDASHPSFDQRH